MANEHQRVLLKTRPHISATRIGLTTLSTDKLPSTTRIVISYSVFAIASYSSASTWTVAGFLRSIGVDEFDVDAAATALMAAGYRTEKYLLHATRESLQAASVALPVVDLVLEFKATATAAAKSIDADNRKRNAQELSEEANIRTDKEPTTTTIEAFKRTETWKEISRSLDQVDKAEFWLSSLPSLTFNGAEIPLQRNVPSLLLYGLTDKNRYNGGSAGSFAVPK